MTREEAIEALKNILAFDIDSQRGTAKKKALEMAIKALEQEPILDKVRAEIENDWQLKDFPSSPFSCGLRRTIEIIDKYKAESEDKE